MSGAPRNGQAIEELSRLQEKLYAHDRLSVRLVFQAMDAAGKDGTIRSVMTGINPQGCQVFSFKAPTSEELDHDYLWRCTKCLPERGRIGIFNRSYYEETWVVRVHPELLAKQKLPPKLVGKKIWQKRFEDIRAFERYLGRNGVLIRKFFLHVSRAEQKRRFLERIDEAEKNWKFAAGDVKERPVYHWTAHRIVSHVKLCVLALLIERAAELRTGETWRTLRLALDELKAVRYQVQGTTIVQSTRPTPEAASILKRLKISPPSRILAAEKASPAAETT